LSLVTCHSSHCFMNRSAEIAEKVGRVQRTLAAEQLGGVLIGAQHNFSWLTAGGI